MRRAPDAGGSRCVQPASTRATPAPATWRRHATWSLTARAMSTSAGGRTTSRHTAKPPATPTGISWPNRSTSSPPPPLPPPMMPSSTATMPHSGSCCCSRCQQPSPPSTTRLSTLSGAARPAPACSGRARACSRDCRVRASRLRVARAPCPSRRCRFGPGRSRTWPPPVPPRRLRRMWRRCGCCVSCRPTAGRRARTSRRCWPAGRGGVRCRRCSTTPTSSSPARGQSCGRCSMSGSGVPRPRPP